MACLMWAYEYNNAITIAASGWHCLDAFYLRRRLFTRSAKLLGSAGLTSVYEALSFPNASRVRTCFALFLRCG